MPEHHEVQGITVLIMSTAETELYLGKNLGKSKEISAALKDPESTAVAIICE